MTREQTNLRRVVRYHWNKHNDKMNTSGLSYVEWFRGEIKFYYYGKHYVIRNMNCDDERILQIY